MGQQDDSHRVAAVGFGKVTPNPRQRRRKLAVETSSLRATGSGAPVDATRHHADLRTCLWSLSAAFQLQDPDSQLGCHRRLSLRHFGQGLDSGDSGSFIAPQAAVGISPRPAIQAIDRQKYNINLPGNGSALSHTSKMDARDNDASNSPSAHGRSPDSLAPPRDSPYLY